MNPHTELKLKIIRDFTKARSGRFSKSAVENILDTYAKSYFQERLAEAMPEEMNDGHDGTDAKCGVCAINSGWNEYKSQLEENLKKEV